MSKRDFLSTADLTRAELDDLLDLAARVKGKRPGQVLAGKTLGLLFFEPSLRTRVSFEVAMVQLGGHCINLSRSDLYELEPSEQAIMDGTAEEHVKDAARTVEVHDVPAGRVLHTLVGHTADVICIAFSPWSLGSALALAVVASIVGPLGDLCESMVKRDLGLKDMGTIVPGHGGVLDRFDALLFVLPATYYLVELLNLAGS